MITQDNLKECLEYKEGKLFWIKQSSSNIRIGMEAGTTNERGYVQVKIFNKRYYAHRLVFFMFNGYFPQEVDHIDGNKNNNRIENLRASTKAQNQHNAKINKNNTSGVKGVTWDKQNKKWKSQCGYNNKNHYLGHFIDKELAKQVVEQFRKQYHHEYARNE
jgi:hypothetical protein